MQNFQFKEIEKGLNGAPTPDDGIRVRKGTITLGDNIMPGVFGGSLVKVLVDEPNQAVKLVRVDMGGYKVQQRELGGPRFFAMTASKIANSGMSQGDYLPVEGQSNVFQKAQ